MAKALGTKNAAEEIKQTNKNTVDRIILDINFSFKNLLTSSQDLAT